MSRPALIIALLLALVLSVVALIVFVGPRSGEADTPGGDPRTINIPIDPASVESITVQRTGRASEEIVERTSEGGWRLRVVQAGEDAAAPWPVIPARVRGLVGVMAQMRPVATGAGDDVSISDRAARATFRHSDGRETSIRVDSQSVGGRRLIEIDGADLGYIDEDVYNALTSPGPRGWRDPTAMPGVGSDASRVRLVVNDVNITAARTGGRWWLRSPANARAEESTVSRLLDALRELRIERFLDDEADARPALTDAGLDSPRYIVEVESDQRQIGDDGDVSVTTQRRRLSIGGMADVAGRLLYATPDEGRTIVIISAEALGKLIPAPAMYVSRRATSVEAANVGSLLLSIDGRDELLFLRSVDGWRAESDPHDDETLHRRVEELLTFLTTRAASDIRLLELDGWSRAAAVTLMDFNGDPLDYVEIGLHGDDMLTTRTVDVPQSRQAIFRMHAGVAAPALLGEEAQAPPVEYAPAK
ncbi:MAG: DUF4340 domain-containing protein [Phycisphaeraceae bacterium]|nr:MAG: DUF4340 domain-containing protein [Phycisphaeraceae bacterium]